VEIRAKRQRSAIEKTGEASPEERTGQKDSGITACPSCLAGSQLEPPDVKRVSSGSGPHRAAMGFLRRMADEARISGTYQALTAGAVPYKQIKRLDGKVK
jgi:hypothetical protein